MTVVHCLCQKPVPVQKEIIHAATEAVATEAVTEIVKEDIDISQ